MLTVNDAITIWSLDLQMIRNLGYVKIIGWFAKILLLLLLDEYFRELNKLS